MSVKDDLTMSYDNLNKKFKDNKVRISLTEVMIHQQTLKTLFQQGLQC